jgi:hypothetical protein
MMARNEYGECVSIPGRHPRKELLEKLGRSHAEKIYVNSKDGEKTFHVGYVIAQRWWSLYIPYEKEEQ